MNKNKNEKNKNSLEVIFLLVLVCIISLFSGAFLNERFRHNDDIYNDPNLKKFINTYEDVLDKYYNKVDKESLIESALEGMFSNLDKNSNYLNQRDSSNFDKQLNGEYKGIGIQIANDKKGNIVVVSVFKDTPAFKAGIKPLDIIIKVNGKDMKNKNTNDLIKIIDKNKAKNLKLTILREEKEIQVNVKSEIVTLNSVDHEVIKKDDKKIGYIAIGIFANNTSSQFEKALNDLEQQNIDSLILDVRYNSGGHLTTTINILSQLISKDHVIYQTEVKGKKEKFYSKGKESKKYPIVVLINEGSASASEVTASALKEQLDAILIGTKSFGKGTVQELRKMPSGDSYKMTTKKWLTSKGVWIDGKGLTPDIKVEMNEEFYKNPVRENDNQLQKALEYIVEK